MLVDIVRQVAALAQVPQVGKAVVVFVVVHVGRGEHHPAPGHRVGLVV